jgi:hypothetical protein
MRYRSLPFSWLLATLLLAAAMLSRTTAADNGEPIHYPAEGNLKLADGAAATVARGDAAALRFVPGRVGKGVYPPLGTALAIPVPKLNPAAGTLSFWFRPDWSDPCYQHAMLAELLAGDAWQLRFRYGYSHIPNGCYVTLGPGPGWTGGAVSGDFRTDSHNLFTGGEWRHYALRWSADRSVIELVVDGYTAPSRGRYTCGQNERLPARLLLNGEACGAFDEVRVCDRWLDDDELIAAAGMTQVRAYLQEQQPPPGAPRAGRAGRQVSYVDPATGKLVTTTVAETDGIYNPAKMPELPETPHTKWARPLAGGPVKALLIMPADFYNDRSSLREGVELWQRLDMECDIVTKPNDEVMRRDYDVIVVGHQGHEGILRSWWSEPKEHGTFMDAKVRQWLTDRVLNGKSGLVLVNPKWWCDKETGKAEVGLTPKRRVPADALLRGFPAPAMNRVELMAEDNIHHGDAYHYEPVYALDDSFFLEPKRFASEVVQVYRDSAVRAVVLEYRLSSDGVQALTPYSGTNSAATLVHYDYWMALAARAVLLAAGREPAARVDSLDLAGDRWTSKFTGSAHRVWYRARDLWGREYASGEVAVEAGQANLRGAMLPPRAVVDLILKDRTGAVLDWYSQATPPATGTRITGIALEREAHAKGDTVRGRVTFQAESAGDHLLTVYLGDHEGRRLVRRQVPVRLESGAGEAGFALTIPPSADSLLMRVDAVLQQGAAIVDERSADCPVPKTTFDGFFAGMSGGARNGAIDRLRRRLFRDQYGVNLMLRSGNGGYATLAQDNFAHFEYTTHLGYPQSEETFKPWIEEWETFLPKNLWCDARKLAPYRPLFYSLGEEHYLLLGGSRQPLALARFQEHLRKRYGSLDNLNEVWKAKFTAWSEIPMVKPEINDAMKIDFGVQQFESRRFMEHLFAQKHADLANYLRGVDPLAKVGIHVGWDLWMGRSYDYWLLSRGMESMIGYGGVQNQYIRSFFQNYYGSWWHYSLGSLEDACWHPWYMLASGARGFMWYTMTPQVWGATTGDLHPSSDWQAAAPEFKAAAQAGRLLTRTTYIQDQVAIHYSQDSMQAGMGPALSWLHNDLANLLFDGDVPFHFLSYEELAAGKAAGVPLLILPASISLSPGEAAAVRDYIRHGGVIWADRPPGVFDHFGRKLPESQLADLFANLDERSLPGGRTLRVSRDGRVILADLGNYAYARNVGEHRPSQELLTEILSRAKVRRVARALDEDGQPANAIWLAGYRQGGQQYLVAAKDYKVVDRRPARVNIVLEAAAHVYESQGGRYLGLQRQFEDTFETARGKVYALLPYRVRGLEARARTQPETALAQRGEDLVVDVKLVVDGAVGPEDLHLLRVTAWGPDGREVTALRRCAAIRGGAGEVRLPIAWNDRAGAWTARLHDTATGLEQSVPFTIR